MGLVFDFLRTLNNFKKVETDFTDKDFSERAICKEFSPDCSLCLCIFHVLKCFRSRLLNNGLSKKIIEFELNKIRRIIRANNKDEIDVVIPTLHALIKNYFF